MYPKLNKWINECWLCHCQGYDRSIVESPDNEETIAVRNIKRYFQPLDLDEDGLCEVCSRLSKNHPDVHSLYRQSCIRIWRRCRWSSIIRGRYQGRVHKKTSIIER